ncbi:hypothetical protein SAMN02745164_00249 [Marinitoga hydrogenitolerans DSM 16785]|uniref:Uncharacterized protein n=1 Tax=Marinitoga hydrogenitolerans (strain DSM 16785 / JCM 12826 / AT1271) TaxID=1122195 RepID=A0A1M4SNU8_MARH1|nr:hypothetical protein [Marinitoga hydrogenitolerans]SHE33839.1 hypothetical protein SAMN02745164_00249 [Marinitoga hydrogenitolerans DSM 16785]
MKKRLFILFLLIFITTVFGSAKLLFPNSIDFYYQRSKNINSGIQYTGFPLFFTEDNDYKSNILFEFPLGFEKRLENNVLFNGGGYYTLEKDKIFFSDLYNEFYSWMNFGFEFYHNDELYARFIADFKEGNSPYFKYDNITIFDIYKDFSISKRTTLDMPSLSYLSLKNHNWSFILGRTKISLGPLKNSLILSDASKYYENINFKYNFKNFSFNTIFISMQPMLTKTEYEKQFSTESTVALKEVWVNRIDYTKNILNLGITSLNLYGGEIPSNPFDTKNSLFAVDAQLQFKNFRFYIQDAFNPLKNKNSFGLGGEFLFELYKDIFFSILYEKYIIDSGIYEDEIPYNRLYNRSLEIINEPGARYFYDYPLGFKYDENSNVNSIQTYISSKELLLLFENEWGSSFGNSFWNKRYKIYYNIPYIGNLEFKYIDTKYNEEKFINYSVFFIIPIKIQ